LGAGDLDRYRDRFLPSLCCYLSADEEEQYYLQSKALARLFKIPESLIPVDLKEFRGYVERMIDGGPVQVNDTARELSRSILYPEFSLVPPILFEPLNLITIGHLPPRLRKDFGLEWSSARELLLDASSVAIRALLPIVPDLLRAVPAARSAESALAAETHRARRQLRRKAC